MGGLGFLGLLEGNLVIQTVQCPKEGNTLPGLTSKLVIILWVCWTGCFKTMKGSIDFGVCFGKCADHNLSRHW